MHAPSSDVPGKNALFMQLYEVVHARLCRFVESMVWDKEEAKDIISETFLQAYEKLDKLREEDKFIYYVFGIARNIFLNRLRRKKFRGIFSDSLEQELATGENSEQRVLNHELQRLLARLNMEQREAITLFEIGGFSYEEIAVIQKAGLNTVKARIFQGRAKLKAFIESEQERINSIIKQQEKSNKATIK